MMAAAVVGGSTVAATAAPQATQPSRLVQVPLTPAKARVVVDAGTGAILEAANDRTPLPVASAIKLLTALVVEPRVKSTDSVRISKRAAGMPALKLPTKAGQRWGADGLLHAMLLASANDAAVALAERAGGGTTRGYHDLFRAEARILHLQDAPTLQDPAGLDDEFSVGGGNLISARDMAIVARAFLGRRDLAAIVRLSEYRFTGGDGKPHRVVSHDRFIRTYPGAIGLKTGYTRRSGYTLVAAARRDGHTLIAVVIQSANTVQEAGDLLDAGFAMVRRGGRGLGHLPEPGPAVGPAATRNGSAPGRQTALTRTDGARPVPVTASTPTTANAGWSATGALQAAALIACFVAALVVVRRRAVVRRRNAMQRRRRREATRRSAARH